MKKSNNEILILKNVSKVYLSGDTEFYALRNVNLVVRRGEYISIKGPSGSGKSTLMHILGLLDTPSSGQVYLLDNDVSTLSESQLARLRNKYIGFVFQQFNLLPKTAAWENVSLPLLYAGTGRSERFQRASEALSKMGILNKLHNRPNQLSGGQQQRVAIARALINNPSVIFADEPTGNLDTKSGETVMKIFDELNQQGITLIIVTHEEEIARHARKRIIIVDGKVSEMKK